MDDLRPCPFCGVVPRISMLDTLYAVKYRISCDSLECSARDVVTGWHESRKIVMDDWNHRPLEDELRRQLAEWEKFTGFLYAHGMLEESHGNP